VNEILEKTIYIMLANEHIVLNLTIILPTISVDNATRNNLLKRGPVFGVPRNRSPENNRVLDYAFGVLALGQLLRRERRKRLNQDLILHVVIKFHMLKKRTIDLHLQAVEDDTSPE
jgi:hypothetical protein